MLRLNRGLNFVLHRKWSLAAFLLLLLGAAFLVRIWGITLCHYWDEWVYLQNAQVIAFGKTNYSELSYRPPLLSLIYAGVFLVWHHIFAACVVTALINALAPVFLYLAGRLAVGRVPAAIAAFLLAFAPFFVGIFPAGFDSDDTGNSLLTDSPALTLVVLGLWLLLRALRKQSRARFATAGFVLALSVLMRFGSMPSVGMLLLLPLLAERRWRALLATGMGLAVGLAPYFIWSRMVYGGFLYTLKLGWANVEGPTASGFYFVQNACTIFSTVAVVGVALAVGHGFWRVARSSGRFQKLRVLLVAGATPQALQAFLWLWLVVGFAFFSHMAHKEPRYILPLAAPVLLLAASGLGLLCRLPGRRLRVAGCLLVAAALVVTFLPLRERLGGPLVSPVEPEEIAVSKYLESNFPQQKTLYMNFNYPVFTYLTNYRIYELRAVGPELYAGLDQMQAGELLVAYRETEGGEPRLEWLDANPKFEKVKEYSTLVIYRRRAWQAAGGFRADTRS